MKPMERMYLASSLALIPIIASPSRSLNTDHSPLPFPLICLMTLSSASVNFRAYTLRSLCLTHTERTGRFRGKKNYSSTLSFFPTRCEIVPSLSVIFMLLKLSEIDHSILESCKLLRTSSFFVFKSLSGGHVENLKSGCFGRPNRVLCFKELRIDFLSNFVF